MSQAAAGVDFEKCCKMSLSVPKIGVDTAARTGLGKALKTAPSKRPRWATPRMRLDHRDRSNETTGRGWTLLPSRRLPVGFPPSISAISLTELAYLAATLLIPQLHDESSHQRLEKL